MTTAATPRSKCRWCKATLAEHSAGTCVDGTGRKFRAYTLSSGASQSFSPTEIELLAAILKHTKRGRIGDVIGVVKRQPDDFQALARKVAAMVRTSEARRDAREAKAS